ncbi:hypothetical protein FGRA07_10996 [Fusarium graminearum]|nr:hypothetical protein FG05_35381 [Fusarium graminearum]PCD25591.1 hypothetical protein FGRA07_10996 [Fusarium graminearum]
MLPTFLAIIFGTMKLDLAVALLSISQQNLDDTRKRLVIHKL